MDIGISSLPNLGPTSAQWLASVGVHTKTDLEKMGVVTAYRACEAMGYNVSLNLLWAMVGALEGMDWREVPDSIKERVLQELESSRQK